jgi:putative SOS response-associated peptidase YedK
MCGRYTLTASREQLAELFRLPEVPELPLRYSIATTQPVPVVRATAGDGRELVPARWGLFPHLAKDPAVRYQQGVERVAQGPPPIPGGCRRGWGASQRLALVRGPRSGAAVG